MYFVTVQEIGLTVTFISKLKVLKKMWGDNFYLF